MTRSRDAILTAARTLLLRDGPAGVTHQRVAAQAGVGRATVYRHWPRPEQLLLDVMAGVDLPFFREPAAPVRPWLAKQLRRLADELTLPNVSAAAATSSSRPPPTGCRQRSHWPQRTANCTRLWTPMTPRRCSSDRSSIEPPC